MIGRGWTRMAICLGAAVFLAVSGCAKREEAPDPNLAVVEGDECAPQELSQSEEQVFSKKNKLDNRLSPVMEEQVRLHFAHYLHERRDTMEKFLRNSLPYINHVRSVFRSQGLPEELACLAYLESGYNPLAVSRSNAVGMWQFISSTGRNFGLRQDWWEDQRMDPYRSTDAAADYLGRLYDMFKDWHLAIASYNGGEGKISRAKAAASASSLHELLSKNDSLDENLQLREETVLYVPRFLAIAKIMNDPEALGLTPAAPESGKTVLLPSVALTARPATDLVELSRRLNMSWSEFLAYNPHFLQSIAPAGRGSTVYIPKTKEEEARKLLAGQLSGAGWKYYTVKKKQSLAAVASATGVPAGIVKQLNPGVMKAGRKLRLPARRGSVPDKPIIFPRGNNLAAGEDNVTAALAELSLPVTKKPSSPRGLSTTKRGEYTVKPGDTLFALARACGISMQELAVLNGGPKALKTLKAGQVIKIPAKASNATSSRQGSDKPRRHTVLTGENGYGIAARYGVPFSALAAANGGKEAMEKLRAGQTLIIPVPAGGQKSAESGKEPAEKAKPAHPSSPRSAKVVNYRVKSGETLWSIARKFSMKPADLLNLNGMNTATRIREGQTVKVIPSN